ncbi:ParB/RepB/Spo0J family partition protein [Micromonospora sp. NPDC049662]|uniref:ParB/RepB/Spo0J family partition protein n=1 Tax=Micromonospora sp. NPDC049662 TaxID=3155397 RepID=UPI0034452457
MAANASTSTGGRKGPAAAARTAGTGKSIDLTALVANKGTAPTVPAQQEQHHRADATARFALLEQIAPNPLNTRTIDLNSESIQEIAASIRLHGQLEPCAVVSRMAFVAKFPEFRETVGEAAYVQVSGGRRRAAVTVLERDGHLEEAGLDITVKNDLAASRDIFVAATAAENLDRRNYDPIEEARAVAHVVREAGKQEAAAERLGRSPGWVTQRLNLLKLEEPLQLAIAAGDVPLREARRLHTLSAQEQLAVLDELRAGARSGDRAFAPDEPAATTQTPEGTEPASRQPEPQTSNGPKLRATRVAAAIQRLGGTPSKIAESLLGELPKDSVEQLIDELRSRLPRE